MDFFYLYSICHPVSAPCVVLPELKVIWFDLIGNFGSCVLMCIICTTPKFQHITPILKSLHWHKVSEQIEYKIISLTYKILNTTQPSYLYDLISIQPPHGHNTRSSPYVTLIKPSSSLKVTHRSFRHASPHLWNQIPTSLRIPHPHIIIHPPLCDHHLNMPV